MLKRHFNVKPMRVITFPIAKLGRNPLAFFQLLKGVWWSDVVYSWFADLNAFFIVLFCMILRKKFVIVAGGYDVAYVPEIDYGDVRSLLGRFRVKFVLKMATKVLAVSKSTRKEALRWATSRNLELVYNGVPVRKFKPSGTKEDLVVTVSALSHSVIKKKGLETFVRASTYLPNVKFVLIGKHEDNSVNRLKSIAGPNLTFTGYVSEETLLQYYQKAKVYCQLSAHESFGVALAEAMSCDCIPVTTRKYAVPEVVGDTGYYVPYNNPKTTAEAIEKALKSDKGAKARERIKRYFSSRVRERKLVTEMLDLTKNSSSSARAHSMHACLKRNQVKDTCESVAEEVDELQYCPNVYHHVKRRRIFLDIVKYNVKLEEQAHVLDMGCGDGWYAEALVAANYQVIGIDISITKLRRAKTRMKADFIAADVNKTPFKDEVFDLIVGAQLLEHISSPEDTVGEAKRITKQKGYLIFEVPSKTNLFDVMVKQFLGIDSAWGLMINSTHVHFFSQDELSNTFFSYGLKLLEVKGTVVLKYALPILSNMFWDARRRFWPFLDMLENTISSIPTVRNFGAIQTFILVKQATQEKSLKCGK